MYVVCGVSVSPGVPKRSVFASGVRSRTRVLRSARSRGDIDGATTGDGARSPGRMPALSAATVGRNTFTCRDGGERVVVAAIEADDGLDGRPADWSVEGLRESLQRLPSREDVDRRLFADGRQCRDRHASIANENRSVLPGCSHPRAGTPVQLPD